MGKGRIFRSTGWSSKERAPKFSVAETQRPHAVRIGVGGGLEPEGGGAVVSPLGASFITFPYYYALIILLT